MDTSRYFKVCVPWLLCLVYGNVSFVHALKAAYVCSENSSGDFRVTLRVDTEGLSIVTGLGAYDASEDPTFITPITASGCSTSTPISTPVTADPLYELDMIIDTSAGDCGVVGTGGNNYKLAIRVEGSDQYYLLHCDTDNLLTYEVENTAFYTTPVKANKLSRFNPTDVKFQVVEADGAYTPTSFVELGQNVKFTVIHNQGFHEIGPDNWGYTFHTGFGHHHDADLVLQIMTPGLGTEVHITGNLPGFEVDIYAKVRRDAAVEVHIPAEYQESYVRGNHWLTEPTGIRIDALHDRIGVKVISRNAFLPVPADRNTAGSFVAIPDDVLGLATNAFQYKLTAIADRFADILIVATDSTGDTDVTITFNNYDLPITFRIDGQQIFSRQQMYTTTLAEYELFHVYCIRYENCRELEISANRPVAVITTHEYSGVSDTPVDITSRKGFYAAQLLPMVNHGEEYVLLFPTSHNFYYVVQDFEGNAFDLENPGSTISNTMDVYLQGSDFTVTNPEVFEVRSSVSTAVYLAAEASFVREDPSILSYPSVGQWGAYQYFYATEGVTYDVYIVAYKGEAQHIKVNSGSVNIDFTAATLGTGNSFVTTDVERIQSEIGDPVRYELYKNFGEFSITNTNNAITETGLIEFKAGRNNKSFMMLAVEKNPAGFFRGVELPFGVRYPPINVCVETSATNLPLGINYYTGPGDLLDNDCDGRVDEEFNNMADDDGDGEIDEDLALGEIQNVGIYVDSLVMDSAPSFDTSALTTIISGGCNQGNPVVDGIGDFTQTTGLHEVFDQYWVLESDVFNAFKIINEDDLYFRVTFGFCYADFDKCEESCQNGPVVRRRSIVSSEDRMHADLHLRFHRNNTLANSVAKTDNAAGTPHLCEYNVLFLVQVLLLLCILVIEVGAISYMCSLKMKFCKGDKRY